MSKMDRTLSRTPSDTERKFNLGQLKTAQGSSAKLESQVQQLSQTLAQYMANTNSKLTESSQTWFYSGVPTLENAPAVDWTDEQKATHIGDLYYNEQDGSLYLFKRTSEVYSWVKCSSATAGTETETYNVTFYSEGGVVIASYIIREGDAVNPPVNDVAWVDSEGVAVTFPYTPTSDTNLYIQESTL
jgi:phage-related protein